MENKRKSNFELLRIVSMLMIIAGHYVYHGGFVESATKMNFVLVSVMRAGGKLGVTCFVLIGAYFLAGRPFKMKNVLRVCIQTSLYSILWAIILIFVGVEIGISGIISSVFAPIYSSYWFATTYIGMLILAPVLNLVLEKWIRPDPFRGGYVLLVVVLVFSILPTIFLGSELYVDNLIWFCCLFLIGGYIRCHGDVIKEWYRVHGIFRPVVVFTLSVLVMVGSANLIKLIGVGESYMYHLYEMQSVFMLSAGVSLFEIFRNLRIQSTTINKIASVTFAVYLIHDNRYARNFIWHEIFKVENFYDANPIIILAVYVGISICFFAVAFIIEIPYKWIQNKLLQSKCAKRLNDKLDAVFKD